MQRRIVLYISKFVGYFLSAVQVYLYNFFRPFYKWVLRRTTGLCELQRLSYCEPPGAPRILGVECSLHKSKNENVKKLITFLDRAAKEKRFTEDGAHLIVRNAVQAVCSIKNIRPDVHQPLGKSFGECVTVIWGYNQLLCELEELRTVAYDSDNTEHERKLLHLWSLLMPNHSLESRICESWKDIGFQGTDPKTDFRGMGILGLENLLFFALNYTNVARHVLSHSIHPQKGYSYAIVGINLTHLAYTLWKDGTAKTHAFNLCGRRQPSPGAPYGRPPVLRHFHRFYCYLFFEFDRLWIKENPENIMEFSRIRSKFETQIRSQLANPSCVFNLTFPVENV